MSAPITEARLAAIEEWATDHATRCHECDAVARVVIPRTTRALCARCAPDVPGAVLPLVSSFADALDLVAEVRRLTAALAAHQGHTDAAVDGVRAMLPEALKIAREQGAEAMRERCDDAITARLAEAVREVREKTYRGTGAERDTAIAVRDVVDALRDTIRALPLDAADGASS